MGEIVAVMALVQSAPFLVVSIGSAGVLGGALALGIRHGIDWDHIAAITDITSTTTAAEPARRERGEDPAAVLFDVAQPAMAASAMGGGGGTVALAESRLSPGEPPRALTFFVRQRRSLFLGTMYAIGHGSMVVVLGLLAILFAEILPAWVDPIMEKVVGVTLVFLGVYLLYSLYRYLRGGGEFRIRSRWMLLFSSIRRATARLRARFGAVHGHTHERDDLDDQQYGAATSYGIGLIHGIGAETGTQVLIIGTAVGAGTRGMSVATLFVFVFGLLISNSIVTLATAAGFVSANKRQGIYVAVGAVAAVFSLALGALYLTNSGSVLPDLDPYFRWIGGPNT